MPTTFFEKLCSHLNKITKVLAKINFGLFTILPVNPVRAKPKSSKSGRLPASIVIILYIAFGPSVLKGKQPMMSDSDCFFIPNRGDASF